MFIGIKYTTGRSPLYSKRCTTVLHGKDTSFHEVHPPDAVTFVRSNEKFAEIVKFCVRYQIPMIPFGSGTSLEGYITVLYGGISLDLLRINKVIENNLDCRVQAGMTRKQLNDHLRSTNLLFPIDPGADASTGGMTATQTSGTNAVRHGTMRNSVTFVRNSRAISAAVCFFGTLAGAVNTVISVMQYRLLVVSVELLDEVQMDALNQYSNLDYPQKTHSFL